MINHYNLQQLMKFKPLIIYKSHATEKTSITDSIKQ